MLEPQLSITRDRAFSDAILRCKVKRKAQVGSKATYPELKSRGTFAHQEIFIFSYVSSFHFLLFHPTGIF